MKTMDGIVKDIIEHGLGKVPWCLLGSNQRYFQFKCISSSIEQYKTDQTYSLYELAPLERFLAKKNELLSTNLLEEIYQSDDSKVMNYIINWDANSKIVLLLQVDKPFITAQQLQETLAIIAKNRIQISQLFQESIGGLING